MSCLRKLKGKKLNGSSEGAGNFVEYHKIQSLQNVEGGGFWVRLASHPVSPFPVKSRLAAPPNQTTLPTLPTAAQLLQSVSHSGPDQTVVQQHCSLSKSNLLTTLQITCAFTQSKNIVSLRPPSSSFFSKTFIQETDFLDSSI